MKHMNTSTKYAFVIMPFKRPFDGYFSEIYSPALLDAGFAATKADDLFAPRPIMDDIRTKILEADLLLCEMSGRNPNVFYELGLAHAIGKPAILLSNAKKDIPFDLQHVRTIVYDTKMAGWELRLRKNIASAAVEVSGSAISWPQPLVSGLNSGRGIGIPGISRIFPNLPSCEQEILDEFSHSKTIRVFLQLGKTVLVGSPKIYDCMEKSIRAGSTVKILHAGLGNRHLSKRIALERGSSYDEWVSDIEYITKRLANLRKRTNGIILSRVHDEAYYWLIFLFDQAAYVQPYLYEHGNTRRAPVFKLTPDSRESVERSLYRVFDKYFTMKWEESIQSIGSIEDLFSPVDPETQQIAVAAVAKYTGLFVFVVPKRFLHENTSVVQFHAVGGKVESGESHVDALSREMNEEIACNGSIINSQTTLLMSSHSDIGQLTLNSDPSPRYIYKRTRSSLDLYGQSVMWLFGYEVELTTAKEPKPCREIAAVLLLSRKLLHVSATRSLRLSEILCGDDGSKIILADSLEVATDLQLVPTGLAAILAAEVEPI